MIKTKKFKFKKYKYKFKKYKYKFKKYKYFIKNIIIINFFYKKTQDSVYLRNNKCLFFIRNNYVFLRTCKKNIKNLKLYFKIKINKKKLLLNIFFKNKSLLNNNNLIKRLKLKTLLMKFFIFFYKKILTKKKLNKTFIIIKFKKIHRQSRFIMYRYRLLIHKKFFKILNLLMRINNYFFKKNINILVVYNKSHSNRNTKLKKKRRK